MFSECYKVMNAHAGDKASLSHGGLHDHKYTMDNNVKSKWRLCDTAVLHYLVFAPFRVTFQNNFVNTGL